MNLLLVERTELSSDGTVRLADRRADHLRGVLGAVVGAQIRAGVVGGGVGTAEVIADDGAAYVLRLAVGDAAVAALPIELVLAIPRPKVLTRVIEAAASFGVAQIALTNAWRVDKSYLSSPRLAPDALALAARLGMEQGATTHQPAIEVHRRLMALLDARWPVERAASPGVRLLAHPGAPPIEAAVTASSGAITLAIGPEGGWIERELDTFLARGFVPVSIGAPILRVETAVAAALGQLLLLRRLTPA
ncbi:MAG TPA: RsmE family RNA methyltransferase [Kofleriaceae bacterium]|nr:RsmE family RNA methyltransferase [Kofleriaceae bacterium]